MSGHRKLAVILVIDIAGFSRLTSVDEERTLARIRTIQGDVIDPAISEHNGRLVKRTGDGALMEFRSVVEAVRCAIQIQDAMHERNIDEPRDRRIDFRMGLHLGDVVEEEDGDLMGDGVNVAARLEGLAAPGSIFLSEDAYRQVRSRIDVTVDDLGEIRLKNIAEPLKVYALKVHPYAAPQPALSAGTADAAVDRPSIAVLPFANMSADPEQEYFADGMVDEIITGLASIRWLTVIARNSTFAYKGQSHDIRKVGSELSVRYVMEGSVRKFGNNVRITVQLAEAATGVQIWAEKFTGSMEDVFDLHDRITAGVIAAIEPSLRKAEINRAKRKRPENLDAYDLYLRGLEQCYLYTQEARKTGLQYLDAAIELDPNFAEAHGVAAFCLQQRYLWGGRESADREKAIAHAEAVANARTDDASSLALSAMVLSALDGRHDTASVMLDRALEQTPSSAIAHICHALVSIIQGKADESARHAESALRLSPFDPMRHIPFHVLAIAKLVAGEPEAAVAYARRGVDASPVFLPGLLTLSICLVELGRLGEAKELVLKIVKAAPDTTLATVHERFLLANGLGIDRVIADLREAGLPY